MLYLAGPRRASSGLGLLVVQLCCTGSTPCCTPAGRAMGTIVERAGKNGTTGYHAQIVVKRDGKVHRETWTFDRRAAAAAWIRKRETELDAPGAHDQAKVEDPTLGAAIDRYVAESRKSIGRTKAQVLQAIKGYPLAALPCSAVTGAEITAFITALGKGAIRRRSGITCRTCRPS
ncbi:hypothetical protein [Methylobacterium sp. J-070]|uniref:hypothetical protein n=1 Tax=Methylobacterium sp. J-070 TaxID=2836650 RepID=UPI0028C457E2|nr:hypothetical protein [Methylobacterium sp. J-070]